MGLRFDPMGGGQFQAAIKAIIEADKQPIKQLEQHKAIEQQKLKLFEQFKSKFAGFDKALSEFTDFRNFRELKANLGDGKALMGVTMDKNVAQPGSYEIEVEQLAKRSSVISNGFSDPDKKNLGIGYVVAKKSNGDTAEIFVDEDHASLHGVANLINAQSDLPFHASVIKDSSDAENPWRLIVTAKQDGKDDSVEFPDFYFLDGEHDLYVSDNNDAQNARIKIDGFEIEADGNQIKDFLQGVNVDLKQARPGQSFMLDISEDHEKIAGKVKGLVDELNSVLDFINKQNQVDDKSDTRGTFAGDTSLQGIEYRLRNLVHEGFPVGKPGTKNFHFMFLNQIGITFDKEGHLEFKEDKFKKALEGDFNGISEGLTGRFGFANQLHAVVGQYTQIGGLLSLREQSLHNRIKNIDNEIDSQERRLDQKQKALTEKFARLQATMANMQQQQQYLTASLGGGGGNLVSQLLGH